MFFPLSISILFLIYEYKQLSTNKENKTPSLKFKQIQALIRTFLFSKKKQRLFTTFKSYMIPLYLFRKKPSYQLSHCMNRFRSKLVPFFNILSTNESKINVLYDVKLYFCFNYYILFYIRRKFCKLLLKF